MSYQPSVTNVVTGVIHRLENIEKQEPRLAPLINELAKIKADRTKDDRQLELRLQNGAVIKVPTSPDLVPIRGLPCQ